MYQLEVTDEQLRVIQNCLEEYFRLRMGQDIDFINDFCAMNLDLSPDNPKYEHVFDRFIQRRNHMHEVMMAAFYIGYGDQKYLDKKTDDMLIAEDLWEGIRFERGVSRWDRPLHVGNEPPAKIRKVEGEDG